MSGEPAPLVDWAGDLRRSFDRSFTQAPPVNGTEFEDLLGIRLATEAYAVRLAEVSGLVADKAVTPLPSPVRELLGIVAVRGAIVPVYDLRALLGYSGSGPQRWLLLAAAPSPLALAVDQFDGHLRTPRGAIARQDGSTTGRPHVRASVRAAGIVRPIVHLASVLETIANRARSATPKKEG